MKDSVYIETTFLSYLTARPSRDPLLAAHQQVTRDWWSRRERFDVFVSLLVVNEASQGDPTAAAERLAAISQIPMLEIEPDADLLAQNLIRELAIPPGEIRDASHVAIAATNGIDYLLTWNCRHLANLRMRGKIERVCRDLGYQPPLIGTPLELSEDKK
jgi:predicted nucleic acid-binding protein